MNATPCRWTTPGRPASEVVGPSVNDTFDADRFAVVVGETECWGCHRSTRVAALLLAGPYQERRMEDAAWETVSEAVLLVNTTHLDPAAQIAVHRVAPWMGWMPSKTAGVVYWANRCEHCRRLQGDFFLHQPGSAFFPIDPQGVEALTVYRIDHPLHANASTHASSWIDAFVARHSL